MSTFKDFYNGLDILNLILFWGTIIVIILIIIFLTLYFSRKRSIHYGTKGIENDDFDDVDIIKNDEQPKQETFNNNIIDNNVYFPQPEIKDEEDFFKDDDEDEELEEKFSKNIQIETNTGTIETKEIKEKQQEEMSKTEVLGKTEVLSDDDSVKLIKKAKK